MYFTKEHIGFLVLYATSSLFRPISNSLFLTNAFLHKHPLRNEYVITSLPLRDIPTPANKIRRYLHIHDETTLMPKETIALFYSNFHLKW